MTMLYYSIFPALLVAAQPTPVGPIGFGKGLNLQANPTSIDDQQTSDSCNCISNQDGTLDERFGSQRYMPHARSTGPVDALYRAYASTGTTKRSVLLAVIGTELVYSTDDISWIVLPSTVHANQNWSFETMNNDVYITGDALLDPVMRFGILSSSFNSNIFSGDVSSQSVAIRAKYLLQKNNYLLYINVMDLTNGTTYYPDRVYYSLLNQPSSTTYNRFLGMPGEELTGGVSVLDRVNFLKPNSIIELTFTNLNLPSQDGDQDLSEIVSGFGAKAPQVTQNLGISYVIGASDGIRLYDGGRRGRLSASEESQVISNNIKPLIERLQKAKTYEKMVCEYYKKREWLVFSYEDPDKSPSGRNNSVIIYDLKSKEWYPICGWLAKSLETRDKVGDDGALLYGDSADGHIYIADLEKAVDDAVKHIPVDTMDSTVTWVGTNINRNRDQIAEGTASIRMWINDSVTVSSITRMDVLNLSEYADKTRVSKTTGPGIVGDLLQFKLHTTSIGNISSLRVDFEVNGISSQFDTNFTSVTISSQAIIQSSSITVSGATWAIVEIALSSFPVRPDWTNFDTENLSFANVLFYYGIRFVLTGVSVSSVSIDDVRIVQELNPIEFYRYSKQFNFNSTAEKTFGELELTLNRQRDSELKIDVVTDFSGKTKTRILEREIPRELIVFGLTSTASIAVVDDTLFTVKRSTDLVLADYNPTNGVATADYIYFFDRSNSRMVKMDRDTFVIISTFGSFGSGATNYNTSHQMDVDENENLYSPDLGNQRVKKINQANLRLLAQTGSLGRDATSYHQPTGATTDGETLLIADEGNYRWKKLDVSTLGVISITQIDYNTVGDTTLDQDRYFYHAAYNKTSDEDHTSQDVVLEERYIGDLSLVKRTRLFVDDIVQTSTNSLAGDLCIRGRYVFVPFTNGIDYYIHKRLKSDHSLVRQYKVDRQIFSVLGDALAYKSDFATERIKLNSSGKYIQFKFYDKGSGPDNRVQLVNFTPKAEAKTITYGGGD